MALMKKSATRYFVVQPDPESPAFLAFNDATPAEVANYRKALVKSHEGNRGVYLDEAHALAAAKVVGVFIWARVVKAHGFVVSEGDGQRELEWPQDKDAIIALIPEGLLDLFRRTVEGLNTPHSAEAFQNAALIGTTTFPNS